MPRIIDETNKPSLLSTDYFLTDSEASGSGKVSFDTLASAVISSANIGNTYATKATAVTDVSYDVTNAKLTKTINGASYDIVSIATLKQLIDTDTHYTSKMIVGSSSSSTSNSAASNGSVYLNIIENNEIRSYNNIQGAGNVTVTSDSNGSITITGVAGDASVSSIATGVGLTGGPITTSGTIKTKLSSESSLGTIGTTSKLYAVGVDSNGYLAVSVPWADSADTAVTQTETSTNANYEVLLSYTADNTTRTEGARKSSNLTFNPSTGGLSANSMTVASSTNYTTAMVRNIILSNAQPSSSDGANGDICIVYS